jgi:hypothetical protein
LATGFIPDGFTRRGYIKEEPRLYGALRFEYRPTRRLTREEHWRALEKVQSDPAKGERLACEFVVSRLAGWELKDATGSAVPLTADAMAHVEPILFERLYMIMLGKAVPDEDPENPEPPPASEGDQLKN